ncbi:putative HAD superfamily protein [Lachnospiraceae bacterium PF1-22]
MITRTTYKCDYCDFERHSSLEVETHEATHIGNGLTLEEYRQWKSLNELFIRHSVRVRGCKNQETEGELDMAIKQLMEFENKHGIEPI